MKEVVWFAGVVTISVVWTVVFVAGLKVVVTLFEAIAVVTFVTTPEVVTVVAFVIFVISVVESLAPFEVVEGVRVELLVVFGVLRVELFAIGVVVKLVF